TGFFVVPRAPVQLHQIPAKANSGRSSPRANQPHSFLPVAGLGSSVGSQKAVAGTRQRFSGFSQARQCDDTVLLMFVTPRSIAPAFRYRGGGGMPQRAMTSSRSPSATVRTLGALSPGRRPASG